MTAKQQRSAIIVLLMGIIGILLFPDVFRKWVIEVATEQTGRGSDSESETRPSPQKETIPFARGSSLTA